GENGAGDKLQTIGANVPTNWSISGTGDFDGDGNADILWRNTTTGDVALWEMNGAAAKLQAFIANAIPTSWSITGVSDFNHDGYSDILLQNADGTPGMWTMNGTTITSTTALANPGQTWHASTR